MNPLGIAISGDAISGDAIYNRDAFAAELVECHTRIEGHRLLRDHKSIASPDRTNSESKVHCDRNEASVGGSTGNGGGITGTRSSMRRGILWRPGWGRIEVMSP